MRPQRAPRTADGGTDAGTLPSRDERTNRLLRGPVLGTLLRLALYFAAQGAGQVGWALAAGLLRAAVALGGGVLALHLGFGPMGLFVALGLGLAVLAAVNAGALAYGAWPRRS